MDPVEYSNIERVEKSHWYNAGKREFVRRWLLDTKVPEKDDVLLDCGACTGLFASEMEKYCRVLVLDAFEPALELLRQRFRPEQVITMTGKHAPLPDKSIDYLTALDVVEHIEDDSAAVQDFHRLLKPGGIAIITVPASMALWSEFDVSLHHFRRYDRKGLLKIFPDSGWEIVHINYTNTLAYLPAWVLRKWRKPRPPGQGEQQQHIPPRWLNSLLKWIFVTTSMWKMPLPFGLSLLLVARKKG